MCGENGPPLTLLSHTQGSSPRVRGKHPCRWRVRVLDGLIPACAGKTPRRSVQYDPCPAHPRVCGENRHGHIRLSIPRGSSPRVRGKQQPPRARRKRGRLIPACAGKTAVIVGVLSGAWAHPRVCGENGGHSRSAARGGGSSPRVRGKPLNRIYMHAVMRLIPACAGKTAGA